MNTLVLNLPVAPVRGDGRSHIYAALSPSLLVLAIFFALPMGLMIGISFSDATSGALTLANYHRFLTDGLSLVGIGRTALMSLLVAISVTALGYPVAYFLARSKGRTRAIVFALAL
ncbi:MAG: ABC transporter permease, partial [Rhizobium sp.]